MDQKTVDAWKHISEQLDQIWPYKRVVAPSHLIEKYNDTIGKESGMQMTQFAVTVDKGTEVSDDLIWEAMTMKVGVEPTVFDDSSRFGNPPVAGKSAEID
jgi:hypothetical protein